MNVTGSSSIAIVQRFDETSVLFRVNQRITAEVLQVSGDQVVLDLNGTQVLAKLTSPDQTAALAERRLAQFIVRDQIGHTIVLQLVHPRSQSTSSVSSDTFTTSIIQELLTMAGLPINEDNLVIAGVLLKQNLPVTKGLIEELKSVLYQIGNWGEKEAQIAASLWGAGMVLSPSTVTLLLSHHGELLPLILSLMGQLKNLLKRSYKSPNVEFVISLLEKSVIDITKSPREIATQLQNSIKLLGCSLEKGIANLLQEVQSRSENNVEKSLISLVQLREELSRGKGHHEIIETIDRLFHTLRVMHFINSSPIKESQRDEWLIFYLPIGFPDVQNSQGDQCEQSSVKIKVAYQRDSEKRYIDPKNTHVIVQAKLSREDFLEVDLSVVLQRIRVEVMASNKKLGYIAQSQIPSLEQGLNHLGYEVKSTSIVIRDTTLMKNSEHDNFWVESSDLNVEI